MSRAPRAALSFLKGQSFPARSRPRGRDGPCMSTSWTRHHTTKDSEATCGKVWPHSTARPVAHRPLLDTWGLARACFGPAPALPRSFRHGAGQPDYPRNAFVTRMGRDEDVSATMRPRRWLAQRDRRRRSSGRREWKCQRLGAQAGAAGRSLERGPLGRRDQGGSPSHDDTRDAPGSS